MFSQETLIHQNLGPPKALNHYCGTNEPPRPNLGLGAPTWHRRTQNQPHLPEAESETQTGEKGGVSWDEETVRKVVLQAGALGTRPGGPPGRGTGLPTPALPEPPLTRGPTKGSGTASSEAVGGKGCRRDVTVAGLLPAPRALGSPREGQEPLSPRLQAWPPSLLRRKSTGVTRHLGLG